MSRICIKIGSAEITNNGEGIDEESIKSVARQTSILMGWGHDVAIVSSGAIASDPDKSHSDNLRSMVGQPMLMMKKIEIFSYYDLLVAQLLITDENFKKIHPKITNQVEKNILECFSFRIVPDINYNDGVSDAETKHLAYCTDNDRTAQIICWSEILKIDYLIIITSTNGVLDNDGNTIELVTEKNFTEARSYAKGGNECGHGEKGMETKIDVCRDIASLGKKAIIIPGTKIDNSILYAMNRFKDDSNCVFKVGTLFI